MSILPLQQHYADHLPAAFYQEVIPSGIGDAQWLIINHQLANALAIDINDHQADLLDVFAGNRLADPNKKPIAMAYAGHQFGHYVPMLGDGRGVLLGEIVVDNGSSKERWDLHLKGAGTTPYSRHGDGRAVLRSTIREYLACEAMHALHIPSTRALCATTSTLPVWREQQETAATLVRVARSHIRFGHFEYFYHHGHHEHVKTLADYCIETYFGDIEPKDSPHKYSQLFERVVSATAEMIALWTAYGFAHGVMNTDNMSILGDTIDYGPYAFLDDYNPHLIGNRSDSQGRYAFHQQPMIGLWNLHALATAMSQLIDADTLNAHLQRYERHFYQHYSGTMIKRAGLEACADEAMPWVDEMLALLRETKADFATAMRSLADVEKNSAVFDWNAISSLPVYRKNKTAWHDCLQRYKQLLKTTGIDDTQRRDAMNQINPLYVLRNYYAQIAIEHAEKGDFSTLHEFANALSNPFSTQTTAIDYSQPPPEHGKGIALSCSS